MEKKTMPYGYEAAYGKIGRYLLKNLQAECQAMQPKGNSIVNLSVTPGYGAEVTFVDQGISSRLLRMPQSTKPSSLPHLSCSCNYLVQEKEDGLWKARSLLLQDEWLVAENVHAALEMFANANGWGKQIAEPEFGEYAAGRGENLFCWFVHIHRRTFCVLIQNGLVLTKRPLCRPAVSVADSVKIGADRFAVVRREEGKIVELIRE